MACEPVAFELEDLHADYRRLMQDYWNPFSLIRGAHATIFLVVDGRVVATTLRSHWVWDFNTEVRIGMPVEELGRVVDIENVRWAKQPLAVDEVRAQLDGS